MNLPSRLQRLLVFLVLGLLLATGLQAQNNNFLLQQQRMQQEQMRQQQQRQQEQQRQEMDRRRQEAERQRQQQMEQQRQRQAELQRQQRLQQQQRQQQQVEAQRQRQQQQQAQRQQQQATRQQQTQALRQTQQKSPAAQPAQRKELAAKLLQGKAQPTRGQTTATTLKAAANKKTLETAGTKQRLEKVKKLAKDRKLREQRIKKTRTEKLQREAKAELAEEQPEKATQLIAAKPDSVKPTTSSVGGGGKKTLDRLKLLKNQNTDQGQSQNAKLEPKPSTKTPLLLSKGKHVPNAGGVIKSFVQKKDQVYYRVYSGSQQGSFLTAIKPKSSAWARNALALPTNNTAAFVQEVLVPSGTRLQRSRALPAFGAKGGAEQFELLEQIPSQHFRPGVPLK